MNTDFQNIERVGGRLCLDFVNTRASHFDTGARDYLGDYQNLIDWLRACDSGLDARQATQLAALAKAHPRRAGAAFAHAHALRDLLYRVFVAAASGSNASRADLDALNLETTEALRHRRLVPGQPWRWSWAGDANLMLPLWQVLASSAELLVADDPMRLKQCPAPDGCGWLFYDTSKNHTRRWCSMRMCGNGAKARRFQRRLRGQVG